MQFIRFIFIGVINTITGLGAIYLLMYFGLSNYMSNFIGYIIGLLISFFLNKYYVFKNYSDKNSTYLQFIKFLVIFLIAYIGNLFTLYIS